MTTAYWCVFVAILLPYTWFGFAASRAGKLRDSHYPRDFPNQLSGLPKRAWGAHLNSFESLPGFAAAVVIAHLAHGAQPHIDTLAVIWVVARVAYGIFYLMDKPTLRSSFQFVSLACVLGLFIVAGRGGLA
ncbi:MAG TPA: MAPEG family protein [Burkholderiales bacterium]|nr:MAPEG family protein [Burkholderiales bacterium]